MTEEKYDQILYLIKKWHSFNEGATTEELKELRELLSDAQQDVADTIGERLNEEAGYEQLELDI